MAHNCAKHYKNNTMIHILLFFGLSFIIVALVLGICLAKMAKTDDDCMTDEGYNPPAIKPVETKEIPWGELRS